jgi:prevent-host-death family protein
MSERVISAEEFQAKFFEVLDNVERLQQEVSITRHGKPVAKLIPYTPDKPGLFGESK